MRDEHRAYLRNLRQFTLELSAVPGAERRLLLNDRREDLADEADWLPRVARRAWSRTLAGFSLGAAGCLVGGNRRRPGALLSLGARLVGGLQTPEAGSASLDPAGRSEGGKAVLL